MAGSTSRCARRSSISGPRPISSPWRESNIDLANQTLAQAQDRFAAGVANNLDVVQAQESVASANQSYIASLYAYNFAKISLAQAIGVAEQSALQYLGAK